MTAAAPRICCLDLDTFFVSVERVLDPSLRGKPVIVGGRPGTRGVVTACSYEVRAQGVRSGMSLTEAGRLAPHAIYLPVREGTYSEYSSQVLEIARRYCPILRSASIDEFFMDFAGCERLYYRPVDGGPDATIERVVRELTDAIERELGLPASVGIATSKPVAKIASGLAKPRGVLLVAAGAEAALLSPLPVRKLPGIGRVAEQKLGRLGIATLGQLAAAPPRALERVFGAWAAQIRNGARGLGDSEMGRDRPAFREHDPHGDVIGSISNERTFREDVRDPSVVEAMLCSLAERVCWRARRRGVRARTVSLKLRYADFDTLSRSRTVPPTDSERVVFPVARELYLRARTRALPIRLLGVSLSNLGLYDEQLRLPLEEPRRAPGADHALRKSVDDLRERYGFDALRLATGVSRKRR